MEEKPDEAGAVALDFVNTVYQKDLDIAEVIQKMKLCSVGHVNDAIMKAQDEIDRLRSLKMKLDKI